MASSTDAMRGALLTLSGVAVDSTAALMRSKLWLLIQQPWPKCVWEAGKYEAEAASWWLGAAIQSVLGAGSTGDQKSLNNNES